MNWGIFFDFYFFFIHLRPKIIITMKNIYLSLLSLSFILLVVNYGYCQANEKNKKRYYIESAIVKYKISGNTKGTEEIYFDKWGEREAHYINVITKTTFFGVKNTTKENTLNILDGDISYSIDLDKKTGVKTLNAGVTTISVLGNGKSPRTMGKEMLEQVGGKKIGEEEILGKKCEVWKALGTKLWFWKGIPLKVSSKLLGIERTSEAVELKTNVKIDESKFKVPPGIKITDYTN